MGFQVIPDVHIYESGVHDTVPDIQTSVKPKMSAEVFTAFFSNISSFSNHAQDYLFKLPEEVKLIMCCEAHKEEQLVKSCFNSRGFSVSYNPPSDTQSGTHGGELVALRSSYESKLVPDEVLNAVRQLG